MRFLIVSGISLRFTEEGHILLHGSRVIMVLMLIQSVDVRNAEKSVSGVSILFITRTGIEQVTVQLNHSCIEQEFDCTDISLDCCWKIILRCQILFKLL